MLFLKPEANEEGHRPINPLNIISIPEDLIGENPYKREFEILYGAIARQDLSELSLYNKLKMLSAGIRLKDLGEYFSGTDGMFLEVEISQYEDGITKDPTHYDDNLMLYFSTAVGYYKLTHNPTHVTKALNIALDADSSPDHLGENAWNAALLYLHKDELRDAPEVPLERYISTLLPTLEKFPQQVKNYNQNTKYNHPHSAVEPSILGLAALRLLLATHTDTSAVTDPEILADIKMCVKAYLELPRLSTSVLPYLEAIKVLLADKVTIDFANATYRTEFHKKSRYKIASTRPAEKEYTN